MVKAVLHPDRPAVDVRGRGFVIDPRDWSITTEAGGGQYGLSFDPWGNLFTCSNSSHIETFVYDARYAARNPAYGAPEPRVMIAADGPAAEVFRASPEEPWRVIRTRWRVGGLVSGPIEGGGRSAGYFTGATGITIYKGDAYGPEYVGNAFIGDAGGNLVHRKRVEWPAGELQPVASRAADEAKREFCAATDTWFRPVDFANAPDGCLYVADMYRETIEHPWSIPPGIKQFLDLNSGNDRGRIYRFVPDGFVRKGRPVPGGMTTGELVRLLEHPNGWHRETAARLLFERQDKAVVAELVRMAKEGPTGLGRMHGLHAMEGLGASSAEIVRAALHDADPLVRRHGLILAERLLVNRAVPEELRRRLIEMAGDEDARVRMQVVFTLGEVDGPDVAEALAVILKRDYRQKWARVAALTSLARGADEVLTNLGDSAELGRGEAGLSLLYELAVLVGTQSRGEAVGRVAAKVSEDRADPSRAMTVARGLAAGADRAGALNAVRAKLAGAFKRAARVAADPSAARSAREAAIGLLAYDEYEMAAPALWAVLDQRDVALQGVAIDAFGRFDAAEIVEQLLRRRDVLAPAMRERLMALLLKRPVHARQVVERIAAGDVKQSELSAAQVSQLLAYPDADVRSLARKTLVLPPDRSAVVEAFKGVATIPGDAARGHKFYLERCVSCHRAGDEGYAVGPDLVSVRNSGREKLLTAVLDPNREVAPTYVVYRIDTTENETVVGVIVSDGPAGIVLRQAYGRETTIPRPRVKKMTSQGQSLMPEGLEAGMSQQDLADLLEFVATAGAAPVAK